MIESIETLEEMNSLKRDIGYTVHCEEDHKNYKMTEDGWVEETAIPMDLYEMNKQIIAQLPPLEDVGEAMDALDAWQNGGYYMLYGREISYFSVLKGEANSTESKFGGTVIDLLDDLSDTIYSIEYDEPSDAYEIWIKVNNAPTVLYLFNYDGGIVEYAR